MLTRGPTSGFELTPPQVEKDILKYHRLLASSPRSDPRRPARLQRLAVLLTRREMPRENDLDKSITHLTEAVLLLSQRGRDVVQMFATLASALLARFEVYNRPEDVISSLNYFRFLRINFHPSETFNIPHSVLTSSLVQALAENLMFGFGDVTQDMEEMVVLSHELLASDTSGGSSGDLGKAFVAFAKASIGKFRLCDPTQRLPERIIQVLREATMVIPDSNHISMVLGRCLTARFETTHAINEYEEAMSIAQIFAHSHCHGDSLTRQEVGIRLILDLLSTRMNSYANPVYLEDSIHLIRSLFHIPSLQDHTRTVLTSFLTVLERQRFGYFGVAGGSVKTPLDSSDTTHGVLSYWSQALHRVGGKPDQDKLLVVQKSDDLRGLLTSLRNDEITDVESAVEHGRALLTSLDPQYTQFSYQFAIHFADILFEAHQRADKLDYLDEAIIAYRDLRGVPSVKEDHFHAANGLLCSLMARFYLSRHREDIEEAMRLYPILADDGYAEVLHRFDVSSNWAHNARLHAHPSILTAYEKAVSLMQEALVFSPTLQTQHFHLIKSSRALGGLPSDYASYQIETSQPEAAIETLERGRALLWSEMRGLRTSTDQLRAADPALAEEFATVNRNLEMVTMSVAQSENTEIGDGEAGMDAFGRLLLEQRRLLEKRDSLITHIQSFSGLGNFLKPLSFDALNSAATHGPVIIINQSRWRSDIIILHKHLPPSVVFTPLDFYLRAKELKDQLLRVRKEKGLDSEDYGLALASILADLYELVGKPVIERLRQLNVPEKSRVWWCPTSALCSLPLHAMGPIPSDDDDRLYLMDLYVCSYTPTLSALIESRKPSPQPESLYKPSLLLVAQPETLPGARGEIDVVQAVGSPVTTLVSETATPTRVVAGLKVHRFVHFVCHGLLETGKPFDASFELHGSNLTLLQIVRSQLPAAEFAFLSACHTAELTEDSIADEGLHLTAAMQFCGFRSVIGTMWAMADTDGADLSKHFYKSIFSESSGRRGVPHYERSARALQFAVKKLRRKRGVTLERWVNFVHYGA